MKKSDIKLLKSNPVSAITHMGITYNDIFISTLKDPYYNYFEFTHSNRYNKNYLWFQSEFDRIKILVYK